MSDNDSAISPNTPMQDLIGQMNYQAAQSAAGLNLSKQMNNMLTAINMNIGKTNASISRVDGSLLKMYDMQKSMNMNIGKVNANITALGKKSDDTNKLLSDILKATGGKTNGVNLYDALENKMESKEVSSNIQIMTDTLISINETLKKLQVPNNSATSAPAAIPPVVAPSTSEKIMGGAAAAARYGLTFGGLLSMGMGATVLGLGGAAAAGSYILGQHSALEVDQAAKQAMENNRKQHLFPSDSDTIISNPRGVGAGIRKKKTETPIEDTMTALKNATGGSNDPFAPAKPEPMSSATPTIRAFPEIPTGTNKFNRNSQSSTPEGLVLGSTATGGFENSAGTITGGLVIGNMGLSTKESLDQEQAQIEKQAKAMTTSDMSYEAKDILYKAMNIRFEASSIQFTGGQGGQSGAIPPNRGDMTVGNGLMDYDERHGGRPPSVKSSDDDKLTPEARKQANELQTNGVLKVPKGGTDNFSSYSAEDLRKKGIVSHTNTDGTKVYTYAPGGVGGHADRIGGSGATKETTVGGNENQQAIIREAKKLGISPMDLATTMMYESAGSMDPWKRGPLDKRSGAAGQVAQGADPYMRGLIQFGTFEQNKYGIHKGMSFSDEMTSIGRYLEDKGLVRWLKEHPNATEEEKRTALYSTINAGSPDEKYWSKTDAWMGGAPGTVADKANEMFNGPHRKKAEKYMSAADGGPATQSAVAPNLGDEVGSLPKMSATATPKTPAMSSSSSDNPSMHMMNPTQRAYDEDDPSFSGMGIVGNEYNKNMMSETARNSKTIERTETLRREQSRINSRKKEDEKRTENNANQSKHNRDSPEPKNPTVTRRELDSVLARHYDWYQNWSATA